MSETDTVGGGGEEKELPSSVTSSQRGVEVSRRLEVTVGVSGAGALRAGGAASRCGAHALARVLWCPLGTSRARSAAGRAPTAEQRHDSGWAGYHPADWRII